MKSWKLRQTETGDKYLPRTFICVEYSKTPLRDDGVHIAYLKPITYFDHLTLQDIKTMNKLYLEKYEYPPVMTKCFEPPV